MGDRPNERHNVFHADLEQRAKDANDALGESQKLRGANGADDQSADDRSGDRQPESPTKTTVKSTPAKAPRNP